MDHAVGAEDVDCHDAGVEVHGEAPQADLGGEALRVVAEGGLAVEGWDGAGYEHAAGGVEVGGDVVGEDCLQEFFGWFGCVLGDLGEGVVGRCEDSIVGGGAVQGFYEVRVVGDEGGELCCVLRGGDQLVDGLVGFAMVGWVLGLAVMGSVEEVVRWDWDFVDVEMGLLVVKDVLGFLANGNSGVESEIDGLVKCRLNVFHDAVKLVFEAAPYLVRTGELLSGVL